MATIVRGDPPYRLPSSGMGPREGWPSNQPEHSCLPALVPPDPDTPPTLAVPQPPTWPPFLWPPGSCHLGSTIPVEVGSRGPHLQGLRFPLHPSFYSKALTVIGGWHLPPPSLWPPPPQRPGVDRATGHGLGPGLGRPCCQRPGHPSPNP